MLPERFIDEAVLNVIKEHLTDFHSSSLNIHFLDWE